MMECLKPNDFNFSGVLYTELQMPHIFSKIGSGTTIQGSSEIKSGGNNMFNVY